MRKVHSLGALVLVTSCGTTMTEPVGDGFFHANSLVFGVNDNPEAVRVVPGTSRVLVLSSKSRELTLIEVFGDTLVEGPSASLFFDDATESELTQLAIDPDGSFAVVTRTIVDKQGESIIDCRGEAVMVSIADDDSFGDILRQVEIGPMPDAVDISPNGQYAIVGNERDVVYGKCEGVAGIDPPSLSLLDLRQGPENVHEVGRVEMRENEEREPESIRFIDDAAFVVSLQDTHEIAIVRVADILSASTVTDADLHPVTLPPNATGQDAWPDGVTVFEDGAGATRIAAAGEANDVITILDESLAVMSEIVIAETDIPVDFPRDGTWGPLFRPDSLDAFELGDKVFLAVSLKASGAIGVWDVTDALLPTVAAMVKVGAHETSDATVESSLGTEGIAASSAGFIVAANEVESSVSLVSAGDGT